MPRVCKICTHEKKVEIDKAIASANGTFRGIARKFETSDDSLLRHVKNCIPKALNSLIEEQQRQRGLVVENEVQRVFRRLNKLIDACDAWLTDPDDPESYTLEVRSNELQVIYLDYNDLGETGKPKRKRAPLSELVKQLAEGNQEAVSIHTKHADPRDLIVKAAGEIKGQLELYGRLLGLFQRDRENETDIARAEERRKWAAEKLREVMRSLHLDESKAKDWMRENTPTAARWLM